MVARIPLSGNPKIGPEDVNVVLKFGGGLHTRASPDEIDPREAAAGFNFLIDLENRNLRNRKPFDLIGTVPNASQIQGGASLLKTDGTVTTLFQAGTTVYKWDGHTTFTSVGSATSASCQYRGHWRSHVYNLTDIVIITDLSLIDVVKQWDGTTFSSVAFTDQSGNPFASSFSAKYCQIDNERVMFANVKAATTTPHLIVASKRSLYTQITTVNRPSSSLGASDPWFLLSPDLKPINGFIATFKGDMISTERGQIFSLTGQDATNFAFAPFYAMSAASGVESLEEIGTDIIYGRAGRIESVVDTNTYGNSEMDDITAIVSDQISAFTGWTIVFNSRLRRTYCFPTGVSEVWVMDNAVRDAGQISPWMRWRTSHALAFQPTFVGSMLDPSDKLEYVFMGDSSGNVYRMEGTGASGDGGTNTIDTQFTTKLVSGRLDAKAYDVEGYVKYQQNLSGTLTLTFQYQGENIFSNSVTIPLSAATGAAYYSGTFYYNHGSDTVYNSFSGKMTRNKFVIPGHANEFQVLAEVTGVNDFSINEIGIRLRGASQ